MHEFLVKTASVQTNILNKFYGLLLSQYFNRILIRKGIVIHCNSFISCFLAQFNDCCKCSRRAPFNYSMVGSR